VAAFMTVSPPKGQASIRFGVAAEPYPPFASKDASGQWVGWEIDLMKAVCRAMNEECAIVEASWDGIIPALKANFFDVIWSTMSITRERSALIDFTDPYYTAPNILIGQRNGDLNISPDHLRGKLIGAQAGTIHDRYLKTRYATSLLKNYQTTDEALQDLVAGRLDYMEGDMVNLLNFLETPLGKGCCEFKGQVIDELGPAGGVAGGIRKGDTALREKLNAALKIVRDSGRVPGDLAQVFSVRYFAVGGRQLSEPVRRQGCGHLSRHFSARALRCG